MPDPAPAAGTRTQREGFRPDIEGLRAIAVLLVLAYHAGVPGFGGGFVGVDVFFVISGFLITGVITRELSSTGRLSLRQFYARRIRRLLPAALVVIVATVVASAILLPPLRMPDVAADGAAAALYVSNIRFAMQATDYLQAELDPSPLLHFWSLGVEEQFYLVWPALLLVAAGRGADPRRIVAVIAAVVVGSLVLSVTLTASNAPWAFFMLPTRAWELGVGALLVVFAARVARLPRFALGVSALVGIVAIAVGAIAFDDTTPFPGVAALLPVGGAALVLAGGLAAPLPSPSRVLAIAPMRWIGGISYSLYLWHWPILVLPAAAVEAPLPWHAVIGLLGLTFVLAAASQRWIEDPIRYGPLAVRRPSRTLALAGVMSVVVAVGSLAVGRVTMVPVAASDASLVEPVLPTSDLAPGSTLPPTRGGPVPTGLVPPLAAVRDDIPPVYAAGCHAEAPVTAPPTCAYGEADAPSSMFLIGDSHAAQWFPTLERIAQIRGLRLVSLTKSSCPAADLEIWHPRLKRPYAECRLWNDAVMDRIVAERPALVVVANTRGAVLLVDGAPIWSSGREDLWTAGVERVLTSIRERAGDVVLLGDTPDPAGDPPVCLSDHLDDVLACATSSRWAVDRGHMDADKRAAAQAGVAFVDPSGWVCPTEPCPATIDRFVVYRDDHHMTATFARALAALLGAALPPLSEG